jgi:hypothetical protein
MEEVGENLEVEVEREVRVEVKMRMMEECANLVVAVGIATVSCVEELLRSFPTKLKKNMGK